MPGWSLDWGRQTVLGHDGMMVELGHDSTLQAQDCCDKLDSEPQIEWRLNKKFLGFFFPEGEIAEFAPGNLSF